MDFQKLTNDAARRTGSHYKLAKAIGVRFNTVYAWRDGKAAPQARHLMRLIELAGKSVKTLAGVGLISFALPYGSGDVQAQDNSVRETTAIHIMRIFDRSGLE